MKENPPQRITSDTQITFSVDGEKIPMYTEETEQSWIIGNDGQIIQVGITNTQTTSREIQREYGGDKRKNITLLPGSETIEQIRLEYPEEKNEYSLEQILAFSFTTNKFNLEGKQTTGTTTIYSAPQSVLKERGIIK